MITEHGETTRTVALPAISFRYLKPSSPVPLSRLSALVSQVLRLPVDRINAAISGVNPHVLRQMRALCRIPRLSTYAIGVIINQLVGQMREDEAFVNVGVWHGFTFLSGALNTDKRCVAVDNFCSAEKYSKGSKRGWMHLYTPAKWYTRCVRSQFMRRLKRMRGEQGELYEMDYRDYFRDVHKGSIGVYMYDGSHDYEHQLNGLKLAEPFFSPNCVVIVDDINCGNALQATLDFMRESTNRYRILMHEHTYCNRHPTLWNGIFIFQPVSSTQLAHAVVWPRTGATRRALPVIHSCV